MTVEPILIGRPSLLRETNALTILRLLREAGSCSKADLVRASGLSAPTVTNVVAHLSAANLVELIGEGESSGGRPPDIIRFKANRGCVAAVDIKADRLRFLLTDLNGHQLGTAESDLPKRSASPEAVCARIGEFVNDLIRKARHKPEQLLALIVGVPAITNVKEGTVLSVSPLGWRAVPLRALLNKEFECLVMIENDTNLAAQGEHYRGAATEESNFVFITIGESVGAGIFLNGKIYHGSQWSAGEIGYLRVPHISARHPTIHEFGQLEKVLGNSGILKSWHGKRGETTRQAKVSRGGEVLDLAAQGNAHAKQILIQRELRILADVILDIALILNPSLILLGGEIGSHPTLLQAVKKLLEDDELAIARVTLGALGTSAVLWGAISVALESTTSLLIQSPTARV